MKPILMLLTGLLLSIVVRAQAIQLQGTGKSELDGGYQRAGTLNGWSRYTKTVAKTTYAIVCRRIATASVWLIEDSRQNTYFGAQADTDQPPSSGWDVGRAGKGLNAGFSLTVEASPLAAPARSAQSRAVRLTNDRNTTRRVIVRIVSAGKETVRARTYQPLETYEYQTLVGDELYLLTEPEGERLMSSKGANVPGRLLLTVGETEASTVYSVSLN
ncbi:MAG: hypothetical protein JWP57_1930 [Spirosoma sp.]|nr:hypothetical protein [Spirosoma sp.]